MAIWETPEVLSGTGQTATPGKQPIKAEVAICIIYAGPVTMEWAYTFRRLNIGYPHIYLFNSNMPYDCARETITRSALAHGVKWLFFLDSDVCPVDLDAVPKLIELSKTKKLPVLSGLYWAKKRENHPIPCAWNKIGEDKEKNTIAYGEMPITPYLDQNALIPCDVAGAGCLLVDAEVFKKLDKSNPNLPFWQWGLTRKDKDGKPLQQLSEDFYFFERCRTELNIQAHVSTLVKAHHICYSRKNANNGEFELLGLP